MGVVNPQKQESQFAWKEQRDLDRLAANPDLVEALATRDAHIANLEAALSEVLLYVVDGNNTAAPCVVAWHQKYKALLAGVAQRTGRSRLLV